MHLEGALRIGLGVGAGRIEHVRITSTRPDAARSLLQGRRRAEIRAALPRLFSVCGRSQAAAGELACAVAAGEPATDAALTRCSAEVSAEVVREHAWCVLLDWPRRIGEEPGQDAIAAARAAEASPSRPARPAEEVAHAVAMAAFGTGADAWLALASSPELDRWIDAGATAAARFLRQTREDEVAQLAKGGADASAVPFLDGHDRGALMDELWKACEADPGFPGRPTFRGAPAETGVLARHQADPLVGALTQAPASRVFVRFVARLRELAQLLAGRLSAAAGAQAMAPGCGAAWVENARGLLVHQVRLEGDRAASYRIVAPTEWNFHPDGALVAALAGTSAGDREVLERRVVRMAHSLDPCVACRVEFDDA